MLRLSFFNMVFAIGIVFSNFCYGAYSQSVDTLRYAVVGEPLPDLVIRNFEGDPKKVVRTSEKTGKWLILDFWNKHCTSCIASFPKMDRISKEFADEVDFYLIGNLDSQKDILKLYDKLKTRYSYNFNAAFDSALFNRLDIYAAPFIIVCDPSGIVRATTYEVDSSKLRSLLDGKDVSFPKTYRTHESRYLYSFDKFKPFMVGSNGAADTAFVFRSILSEFAGRQRQTFTSLQHFFHTGQLSALGIRPSELYNMAYFGQYNLAYGDSLYGKVLSEPLVALADGRRILASEYFGKNWQVMYNVNLPDSVRNFRRLQRIIANDLQNYFNFSARIDSVNWEVYELIIVDSTLLRKATSKSTVSDNVGFSNGPLYFKGRTLSYMLWYISLGNDQSKIFKDLTDLSTSKYDIKFDCLLRDLSDVRRTFQRYGLDLVKVQRPIKVILLQKID